MKYLRGEEVLVIHSEIIEKTGGLHGLRDTGLFLSILEKSRMTFDGKELYKGVFEKAAAYFESFAKYHVFVDGNKRTAVAVSARFLFLNSLELTATNKEVEKFTLKIVTKKLDVKAITGWLEKHSQEIKKKH